MRGIKVPQQDFALKMPGGGGLCVRGVWPICGTLQYFQCEARYSEQVQGTRQLSFVVYQFNHHLDFKDFNQDGHCLFP